MRILILSSLACASSMAYRLTKEGHAVRMWIKDPDYRKVGDGFVEKVGAWESSVNWADLVIADDNRFGAICETLRKKGKAVWGGSEWSDAIEDDRQKGQETFKAMGMTVVPSKNFSSLPDAIAYVKANPGRYVAKPSGTISDEKTLSYVGKEDNGLDLLSVLEEYSAKWASKISKIELQEFKKGIEVAVSGFFNGKEFAEPVLVNFEHKKLMAGDIGPATGEMGTVGVWMAKRKIYRETLGRAVKLLADHHYVGHIDINCIATEKEIWPLEWTSRFGYPTTQLEMETIRGNMGLWMSRVSHGEAADFTISNPYSICVVIATPPFPFASKDIYKKYAEDQKVIFRSKDRAGIWPGDMRREKDEWYLTGESGFSVICTGSGKTLEDAKKMAYARVDRLIIPNSFHRNDIGGKTEEHLKKLNSWGWFEK